MHIDLFTLYLLAVGTLFASAAMTLWESLTHPKRSKVLKMLAAGYGTLALGCAMAIVRNRLPGVTGAALSNLVIVAGYLLVLNGVASLSGRRYLLGSIGLLLIQAFAWLIAGPRWESFVWNYASAVPIALVSGLTARDILRTHGMRGLQSQYIVAVVTGIHATFYGVRAFVLPWLVTRHGQGMEAFASGLTMYEGVLYSVILPMTLLRLVREEAHGELLQESQTDYLTQLGNRRWFFEEGGRVIRDNGGSAPVSLLAFDLDHFKSINDRYGHETGDAVLQSFATIVRNVVGDGAVIARIGGEEFAALLPHDGAHAKALGERLARRFADTIFHGIDGAGISATVSIGLAQLGEETSSLAELLAASDRALYQAKSLGGNRLQSAQKLPGRQWWLEGEKDARRNFRRPGER